MKRMILVFSAIILLLIIHRSSNGADPTPQALRVEINEFRFTMDRFSLEGERPVVLTLVNNGKMQHEFASDLFAGGDAEVELDGVIVGGKQIEEVELAPGKSVKVTFTPQKKGKVDFICDLPGHREKGMIGSVSVR